MTMSVQRVEGILEESRKIEFIPSVQKGFAWLFFTLGWLVGICIVGFLKTVWRVATFLWVAAVVGFRSAYAKKGG